MARTLRGLNQRQVGNRYQGYLLDKWEGWVGITEKTRLERRSWVVSGTYRFGTFRRALSRLQGTPLWLLKGIRAADFGVGVISPWRWWANLNLRVRVHGCDIWGHTVHLVGIKQPKLSNAYENLKEEISPAVNCNEKEKPSGHPARDICYCQQACCAQITCNTKRIMDDLVIVARSLSVLVTLNQILVTCTPFCRVYL